MLTYNEDIFKKILVHAGVDCYASAENKKFVVPTNVQTVWEMVFPLSLRSMMSVISYSAFNGGNSDSRNGNDGRRNQIKYALKSPSSEIYRNVNEHIGHLIEENALLAIVWKLHGPAAIMRCFLCMMPNVLMKQENCWMKPCRFTVT